MALTSLLKIAAGEALKKGGSKALSKALPRNIEVPKKTDEIVEDYVPFTKVDDTQDVLRALGRTEDDITQFKKSTSEGGQRLTEKEKKVYSNPELEEEARKLDKGLITLDKFKKMRDILKPLKTYGTVPKLFDDFDILGSVGKKVKEHGIIGVNKNIKQGTKVDTRFDINAYKNYGRYVVTVRKDGDVFGYAPTAILKNVKFAGHIPPTKESAKTLGQKSFNVAKAGQKSPFAVMKGKWQDVSPESTEKYAQRIFEKGKVNKAGETDKEWTEIGFDPSSRTSFYNRSTGEPIFEAEKVIQVGPMLLARGIKKPTKKQLEQLKFTIQSGKELEGYKQGGLISLNEGGDIYGEETADINVDFGPDLTEEDFDYTDADILAGQRAKGSTRPDDTVPGDLGPEEAQILSRDRSFFTKSPQEVLAMTSMTPQQIRDKQGGDFGESTPMLTFDTIVYEGLPTEEGPDWTEEGGLRTDFYNRLMKDKEKNLIDTLKSLGARELRELDTLYKGWRTLDPKDYPPEVIDSINQLKQDRPNLFDPLDDFAYTKRGQARSKNVLDNIQDNRDKAMRLLSDSGTSSNIYRKGGGKIMAGGLSGMNRGMMIGGQPYRLSYIDPRQAKVGGPVIRRQDGGEVDMYGTATPDMDYTEDDFTSYADEGIDVNIPDVGYMGDFAFAPDPQGRVGLMGPDEVAGVDIAQTYLSPDPKSSELGVYETQSGLERFVANLLPDSLNKNLNISKDPQRFVSDKELENRYGDRAGLQKDLINLNNKYAFNLSKSNKAIQDKEAEEIEKQGFVSSKREGEIKRDSAVEAAKKTFGEDNFREFKGIDYPAYMPGGTAVAIGNFIAKMAGVIGTAEVRGVPVHVKEDGSISVISPENEPGFDQSKMDLGNEPAPSRRRLPVSTAAATSQDEAETPKTGMAGLLARRSAPASRSESNVFLSRLLDNIYGTDRSKMLG